MAILKAEGIVIRTMRFGETSKLVTFFTREHGLVKVIAKGSRATKSRFGAALEVPTVARIIYYDKETRDLQTLSHAEVSEYFPDLHDDLKKWGLACVCCELVNRSQKGTESKSSLYPILLHTLQAMNQAKEPELFLWGFQMKLLGVLGVAPNLQTCLNCGRRPPAMVNGQPRPHEKLCDFNVPRGGFLCDRCSQESGVLRLSTETMRLLTGFQTLHPGKLSHLQPSSAAKKEIENFFRAYFSFHLEEIGVLTSMKFVKELNAGAR